MADKAKGVVDDEPIAAPDDDVTLVPPATPAGKKKGGNWVEPPGYFGRPECLQQFLEQGKGRTLQRIIDHAKAIGRIPPAKGTLKTWSARDNWADKASLYDTEVAMKADDLMKAKKAITGARECMDLASEFRKTAGKLIKRLNNRIDTIKVKSGGEAKALAEAAVSLNRAAEVLDGGIGDRTEHRETLTIEERQTAAMNLVADVFKQVRTKGNDNKQSERSVGDAPDARRSGSGL